MFVAHAHTQIQTHTCTTHTHAHKHMYTQSDPVVNTISEPLHTDYIASLTNSIE